MNWTHVVKSPTDQQWESDAPRARIIATSFLVGDAIQGTDIATPATPSEYEAYIYRNKKWLMVDRFSELANAQAAVEKAALQLTPEEIAARKARTNSNKG
ncbi:MAG: hypothetical protein ACYDBJ_20295 [Aggregatilineales bacterium]